MDATNRYLHFHAPTPNSSIMSVTYNKAPLVELIAELWWGDGIATPQQQNQPQTIRLSIPQTKDEEICMHFGAILSAAGYGRFERTTPPGMLVPPNQVVVRCRPNDPNKQSPLFQLGGGIFTANALPPYKSWVDFKPIIGQGIASVLEAYQKAGQSPPGFSAALVRYIDAFRDDLTGGRDVRTFLREVMNIDLSLPDAITSISAEQSTIVPTLQLDIPSSTGRVGINFLKGRYGNDKAILMETSILIERAMGADTTAALDALTEGRQIVHDLFRGLTAPIHDAMEPTT